MVGVPCRHRGYLVLPQDWHGGEHNHVGPNVEETPGICLAWYLPRQGGITSTTNKKFHEHKGNDTMTGDGCCDPSTTRSTDSDVPDKTLEEGWPRGPELSTPLEIVAQVVERALQRAVFGGNELARRHFFRLVGASTATAIIRSVFPLDTAKALTQEKVKGLEKTDLTVSFIPITCATPIINAEPMGFMRGAA